jgi:hypothetical protein
MCPTAISVGYRAQLTSYELFHLWLPCSTPKMDLTFYFRSLSFPVMLSIAEHCAGPNAATVLVPGSTSVLPASQTSSATIFCSFAATMSAFGACIRQFPTGRCVLRAKLPQVPSRCCTARILWPHPELPMPSQVVAIARALGDRRPRRRAHTELLFFQTTFPGHHERL